MCVCYAASPNSSFQNKGANKNSAATAQGRETPGVNKTFITKISKNQRLRTARRQEWLTPVATQQWQTAKTARAIR
jgi:hypothetical protein